MQSAKACWDFCLFEDLFVRIKNSIRLYTLALLSFAMATFLLVHFVLIWVYGKFYIFESNMFILSLETTVDGSGSVFSVFIVLLNNAQKKIIRPFNPQIYNRSRSQ